MEAKDLLLKEFLEKGLVRIGSPNGGLREIYVPGVWVVASTNEGTELVANRLPDGNRNGSPLSYDESNRRHIEKKDKKDVLKQSLFRTNSYARQNTSREEPKGTSEAIVNRIQPSRMILMAPHSPETQRKVAALLFERSKRVLARAARGMYGAIKIEITDNALKAVQEYDNVAEENSRPIKDRLRSMVEKTFFDVLKNANFSKEQIEKGFTLDIRKNEDKTFSLVLLEGTHAATKELWSEPIVVTFKERETNPIPDERIDHVLKVADRIQEHVFGAEGALEKVGRVLLLAEEARYARRKTWDSHTRATTLAFFGPSSTGKTETGKAIARELFPEYGEERRVDIDCNKIKTFEDVKTMIWGHGIGTSAISSEFMLKYDQYDGDLIVVLEEFTNIPREVQKAFYDLFREPHPKFADGKDRPMTKVVLLLTGNAGLEWYTQVPRDVPLRVQMAAWSRIYNDSMDDPEFQRVTLDKYMPEPLVNRIGNSNIVWFSPHTFKSIRELTLFKINKSIKALDFSSGPATP
jgi:ATP-dependent Clp protease ATP-binding subunit ClpA